jgi:hypothetical protein
MPSICCNRQNVVPNLRHLPIQIVALQGLNRSQGCPNDALSRSLPKGRGTSIESELLRMAQEVVAESQAGSAYAYKAYLEAQARTAQLKAKLDFANLAEDRLANFQVKIGADYQCPRCWIERHSRAQLLPRPGGPKEDILECRNGHTFYIPF